MARDDGGALVPAPAPTPAPGQVYLPAWRRAYDRLVKMLRQAYAQAKELSVEREHLITELQFLQSGLREREEISQACLQQICKHEELRKRVVEAGTAARLGGKELQIHCYQKFAELAEDDLEVFTPKFGRRVTGTRKFQIMSSRNQLRADRNQLIQMQNWNRLSSDIASG
ncbi:uncharacterized protein [Miscanthus floridulus]|uniref:uncharacterized protein n=1 Tax=Miscanthus floridulus TaxID=154761 RepID=UPI003458F585